MLEDICHMSRLQYEEALRMNIRLTHSLQNCLSLSMLIHIPCILVLVMSSLLMVKGKCVFQLVQREEILQTMSESLILINKSAAVFMAYKLLCVLQKLD